MYYLLFINKKLQVITLQIGQNGLHMKKESNLSLF